MNTITIILSESGRIADLKKDFPLYQGSFQNKLLNVLVPTSILSGKLNSQYIGDDGFIQTKDGVHTAIKIGMTYLKRNGAIETSQSYYMRYLKTINYDGVQYYLYERKMPREFTLFSGQLENAPKLVINIVNVLNHIYTTINEDGTQTKTIGEPIILETITTQDCSLDVLPSSILDADENVEATDLELIEGETNSILKELPNKSNRNESVLKYNVAESFPVDIVYNKNGIKTQGVCFYNETFEIPTPDGTLTNETGTIIVFNTRVSNDGSVFYQDEIFKFNSGIMQRTLTLSNEDFSLIIDSDWAITNKEWLDSLDRKTQDNLDALDKKIDKNTENLDKKIDTNVSALDKKIGANTTGISNIKQDYVSKSINTTPLVSSEAFSVSQTGALLQNETIFDIKTGAITTREKIAIPVTNTKARLFLVQEQESLQDLLRWQSSLKSQGLNYQVDLSSVPSGETSSKEVQDYLTQLYYTSANVTTEPLDQTTLTDEVLSKSYIYYLNNAQWFLHQASISTATNNMYDEDGNLTQKGAGGVIVGSSLKYYAFVEANGEVAINGLDELEELAKSKQDKVNNIDMTGILGVLYGDGVAEIEYDLSVNEENGKVGKISIPIKSSDGSIIVDADEAGMGIDIHLAEAGGNFATTDTEQEITGAKTFTEVVLKPSKYNSIGISSTPLGLANSSNIRSTVFGANILGYGNESTLLGQGVNCSSQGTSIGASSKTTGQYGVAIGCGAQQTAGTAHGIQIGQGTNPNGGTLQVWSYQLLEKNTGKIPDERISDELIGRISTLETNVGELGTGLDEINGEEI
jgi:hypothetical protein